MDHPAQRRTVVTDALSHSTSLAYDVHGRLIRRTDALNQETLYACDADHNLTSLTDARGHSWQLSWDGMGNLLPRPDSYGGQPQL
jgi:YD repeat-containing protein